MNWLCYFGVHRWKPVYRLLPVARLQQVYRWIMPPLFAGPPFQVPWFKHLSRCDRIGEKCTRCGLRRPNRWL